VHAHREVHADPDATGERQLAIEVTARQVRKRDRSSNRSTPLMTATQVSWTTSSTSASSRR
jgi:hypothetical protein